MPWRLSPFIDCSIIAENDAIFLTEATDHTKDPTRFYECTKSKLI